MSADTVLFTTALLLSFSVGISFPVDRLAPNGADQAQPAPPRGITVAPFEAGTGALLAEMCRLRGPITTPDGETFATYVRHALVGEISRSSLKAEPAAGVQIQGKLDALDFSTTRGEWRMQLTLRSSNGKELTIEDDFKFPVLFNGDTACRVAAKSFAPALRTSLGRQLQRAEFAALLQ